MLPVDQSGYSPLQDTGSRLIDKYSIYTAPEWA